jgi:hypothetical protein
MRMGEESRDVAYRQRLNDAAVASELEAIRAEEEMKSVADGYDRARVVAKEAGGETQAALEQQVRSVFSMLSGLSNRIAEFYRSISESNLLPESELYRIDSPFALNTQSLPSPRTAALGAAGVVTIAFLALLGGCALHRARVNRRVPAR